MSDGEVLPPAQKFNLKFAKPANYKEAVEDIKSRTGLDGPTVEGVLGNIVMIPHSRESAGQIASRWGVSMSQLAICREMGKVSIEDARAMLGTKSLVLANRAMDALADEMNDPVTLANMKPKDKLAIAKQMTDNALNLENKQVGGNGQTNIDVGTVQILIQNREAREKEGGSDAMALLLARGLNPKVAEKQE